MSEVLVVVGPGVVADAGLLAEIAEREFAALGVLGRIEHARDAAHLLSLTNTPPNTENTASPTTNAASPADAPVSADGSRRADALWRAGDGAVVILPGPTSEVRGLITEPLGLSRRPVVWVDVERVDGVTPGEGATHLHGRGIGGLAWGIRHAVHRVRHPSQRIAYGPEREQWGDLYRPDLSDRLDRPDRGGRVPVVALIHGGYWRSIWAADIMEALCADLAGRRLAVWNLEYRRPDLHGWQATISDVSAGLSALTDLVPAAAELDLSRVAVAGHSAGAQLALRAAADGSRMSLAVSLAGVLDLVEGDRRWLSSGAVAAALGHPAPTGHQGTSGHHAPTGPDGGAGGARGQAADVYAGASPLLRVPLHVRQLIVQGTADDLDLVDFSRRYAAAAREAGDEVTYLEMLGDHFDVITPTSPIWQATAEAIVRALA
ncbi:alpha/beta hydrolase [Nonomuraea zeae]|uniref:Alpha/beta hydrolase n=1 Tax=Nonomuraea zeae TaxID=1642303 RepID=A0A5S4F7Y5_9ACTN|nr:alpha/beta hydrolase [Nonomuraea zeae]TMR12525.1 alpha/beta hydrolase [Nonomuraea zeae]